MAVIEQLFCISPTVSAESLELEDQVRQHAVGTDSVTDCTVDVIILADQYGRRFNVLLPQWQRALRLRTQSLPGDRDRKDEDDGLITSKSDASKT